MILPRLAGLSLALIAQGSLAVAAPPAASPPSPSTRAERERLAAIPSWYLEAHKFMGAVLVVRDRQVLLDRGYGYANLDWAIPNAPDVKFRIGSITKQFTAALVLLLQQDGTLNIREPLSKYLPGAPKAWAEVTLEDLLRQTSGIADFTEAPEFPVWAASPHEGTDFYALVKDKPLAFKPGSKFVYSNTNYLVLQAVIEAASGKPYAQLLQGRLLGPLTLSSTGLDRDELVLPHRALGYQEEPGGPQYAHSESMSVPGGAGAMYSTTHDLAAWDAALFGGKVLSQASLTAMTTAKQGGYAMGLVVAGAGAERVIWHNGGIEGFHSYLGWSPEQQIVVVVLSNDESPTVESIAGKLLDVAEGKPVLLPSERRAVRISQEELRRFAGTFVFEDMPQPTEFLITSKGLVWGKAKHPLIYQGLRGGHPMFFEPAREMEVEFIPASQGHLDSVVVRTGGEVLMGRRS